MVPSLILFELIGRRFKGTLSRSRVSRLASRRRRILLYSKKCAAYTLEISKRFFVVVRLFEIIQFFSVGWIFVSFCGFISYMPLAVMIFGIPLFSFEFRGRNPKITTATTTTARERKK